MSKQTSPFDTAQLAAEKLKPIQDSKGFPYVVLYYRSKNRTVDIWVHHEEYAKCFGTNGTEHHRNRLTDLDDYIDELLQPKKEEAV